MLAIIKEKDKYYIANYLAIKHNEFDSECAVFDSKNKKLKLLKIWDNVNGKVSRNIFIVDIRGVDCKKSNWLVSESLAKNDELSRKLFDKGEVKVSEFPELEQYAKTPFLPEWFEVVDETDINSLKEASYNFHDATIAEKAFNGNDITIKFDTSWQCYVTVKFHNVKASPCLDDIMLIFESKIEKCDNYFKFIFADFVGNDYSKDSELDAIIECEKISWKIEVQ